MGGTFACPECGNPLELKGLAPGREVRCGWCRTRVEVPFLPRAAGRRRPSTGRRRAPRWARWAWPLVGLAAILLVAAGTGRMFLKRTRQVHAEALERLTAEAKDDERDGRLGPALAAIEAALVEAGKLEPRDEARLDELRAWRGRVARREIEGRLAVVAGMAPEAAIGSCLTLLARVRDDPGLDGLEAAIRDQLDRARERSVAADLDAARRALDAGQAAGVLEHCERLVETANALTSHTRRTARDEADALVTAVVERRGLIVGAIDGEFVLGSVASYSRDFDPMFADSLRRHGYVPRPASSYWSPVWDRLAPFHLDVGVKETLPEEYMESRNRISNIAVTLVLNQKGRPSAIWQGGASGRTRVPVRGLPALQAGRLASGDRRVPAVEHLFYEDARTVLLERLSLQLRAIPEALSPISSPPDRS